ncbi:MAG: short-chain dehydrogenase [Deltaproteobacteria bacterium]|nr:short-chain dehydrogenase [Deltaproteobacteria bacterium]HCH64187.1 short-chain dehydrogenase [Deltaproteobacteria bacterium]
MSDPTRQSIGAAPLPLEGHLALVTGGSRGIGEAIARGMVQAGARVVIASRKRANLEAAVERISPDAPEKVIPFVLHTGRVEELQSNVQSLVDAHGVPSILVNNAATNPYFGPMLDLEWRAWDKTFEVNVKGPFELTRLLARRWVASGTPGRVLHISSIFGLRAAPHQGIYAMTKACLVSLTRTLAHELGPHGIRVNALAPGLIVTRFAKVLVETEAFRRPYENRSALKRVGQPDEIAGMAVHLCSDAAGFTTGQVIELDGGYGIG